MCYSIFPSGPFGADLNIRTTRPWAGIPYWQFEDEDFEFYLKNSGDEEEIARIEEVEETSGSSLPKLKRVTGLVPVRT